METKLQGNPVKLVGDLPSVGQSLPDFTLVNGELGEVGLQNFAGSQLILNIFPSVDTGTCAAAVRRFNQEAGNKEGTIVLCISCDLPFAQSRFCGAEGLDKVTSLSAYRSSFGDDYGIRQADGPLQGLLARAVLVSDTDHKIVHSQLVDEITVEPDYASALASLR